MQKNNTWVVAKEFIRKNITSWTYWLQILSPVLVMLVVGSITYFAVNTMNNNQLANPDKVAVVTGDSDITDMIEEVNANSDRIKFEVYDDRALAEKYVNADDLDGYVLIEDDVVKLYTKISKDRPNIEQLTSAIYNHKVLEIALANGISESDLSTIQAGTLTVENFTIGVEDAEEEFTLELKDAVAYLVGIVIFMVIINYTSVLIQEIAAERGTKVIEIIMSSISPEEHFNGKIIGTLVLVGVNLLVYIVVGVVALVVGYGMVDQLVDEGLLKLGGQFLPILLFGLAYLVLSVILYVLISIYLGLSANQLEDGQKLMTPLVFTSLIGFYVG